MSKQPEALRIARDLDDHNASIDRRAAAELRRQHAEIDRLTAERDKWMQLHKVTADLYDKVVKERDTIRDLLAQLVKMVDDGSIHGRLYSAGLQSEREVMALEKERDALRAANKDLQDWYDAAIADAKRLEWLSQQGASFGFQDIHEGNRWEIAGPYATLRIAIDAEMKGQP